MKHGFNAGALHGDMDQMSRMATLDAFREGRITFLAASDVAARGLDIPDVSHIFNFDVPWQSDDYVHRIGRTGRAGKEGRSLTIVTPDDFKALQGHREDAGRARHLDRRSAERGGHRQRSQAQAWPRRPRWAAIFQSPRATQRRQGWSQWRRTPWPAASSLRARPNDAGASERRGSRRAIGAAHDACGKSIGGPSVAGAARAPATAPGPGVGTAARCPRRGAAA